MVWSLVTKASMQFSFVSNWNVLATRVIKSPFPWPPLKIWSIFYTVNFLADRVILVWHLTTKHGYLQVYLYKVICLVLIFQWHLFFLILQDSCKPLCHLQRSNGNLSTYNNVHILECFMPSLTEIDPNQDNFYYFAIISPCNEVWSFL